MAVIRVDANTLVEEYIVLSLYSEQSNLEVKFSLPHSRENLERFLQQKLEWEGLVDDNVASIDWENRPLDQSSSSDGSNYTIHFFKIGEKKFDIRHEMEMADDGSEIHFFVVYHAGLPFENGMFYRKLKLDPMTDAQFELNQPSPFHVIPSSLEREVKKYYFTDH